MTNGNNMSRHKKAIGIFRANGGQLHMKQAIDKGISRRTLYAMHDVGVIERVTRGIYRLCELDPFSNPDLVTVALRFPKSVICLISALSLHEITTQIPRAVSIAVSRKSRLPSLEYPTIDAHRFSGDAFTQGVEEHRVEGVLLLVYSVEKTRAVSHHIWHFLVRMSVTLANSETDLGDNFAGCGSRLLLSAG